MRPYYIVPDGKVGHDAYAVIRETIRSLDQVAIARVVLTNREHVIALPAPTRPNGNSRPEGSFSLLEQCSGNLIGNC